MCKPTGPATIYKMHFNKYEETLCIDNFYQWKKIFRKHVCAWNQLYFFLAYIAIVEITWLYY